jgi:DNA-binding GntR family transcriptional regulator
VVADMLRRLVLGAFEPGSRITERRIVDDYKATHGLAREALHRLDKLGAVTLSSRRGATVVGREDADPGEMRPVWVGLLRLAADLAGQRDIAQQGALADLQNVPLRRDAWLGYQAMQERLDLLGVWSGNARLTTALQRIGLQVTVASGGRSPIDRGALDRLVAAVARTRAGSTAKLADLTMAATAPRAFARNATEAVLRAAPPAGAFESAVPLSAPIRAYFQRVSDLIGSVPMSAPPAVDQFAAVIRQRIHFGMLRPGDPIRELPLARSFGTSRGPVRDALRALDRQGLVTIEGRRGAFVRQLTAADVESLFQVRAALSGVLMAEAAGAMDRPDWVERELRAGVKLLESIADDEAVPPSTYILVRRAVGWLILAASGNLAVGRIAAELEQEVSILWATVLRKERQKKSARTWRKIVDAIAKHDVQAADEFGRKIVQDAALAALEAPELRARLEPSKPG